MALFSKELGIDLGTNYIRVAQGNQIVLEEPTVAAIVVEEQKMVAWGQEAQDMYGRVPETLEVTRPLQNGVIADYEVTEYMLHALLTRIGSPVRFFRPNVMITVPYGVTSVESRAVHEAALQAGGREVYYPHPIQKHVDRAELAEEALHRDGADERREDQRGQHSNGQELSPPKYTSR